jgi:putative MATE family efflux protein
MKTKSDRFYQQLLTTVFPLVIQAFMLALVSATDAVMLGFVDQTSMSSVSLGGQVQFVLNLFVLGITGGLSILTAQYWGKGDHEVVERLIPRNLLYMLLIGGLFTLGAAFVPGLIMRLLTNDAQLIVCGTEYLRTVSLSYVLCAVSQVYLTTLKTTGRAGIASRISSFAVALNIVLNAILIFGLFGAPKLGIVGAAVATVLARATELVWSMAAAGKKTELTLPDGEKKTVVVRVRWSKMFVPEPELYRDYWRYTGPLLAASLVWGVAYTLYSIIMGHLGADAVAAHSVTNIARSLIACMTRGLGNGAGIMVGHVLGTGDLAMAKETGGRLTRLSIVSGIVTGCLLMLLSPLIVRIAPLTETASSYLQGMLLFCGLNLMFQSVNHTVLDGVFCAGGDSAFDMYGNIGAMWCFSVPLAFLAAFVLKAHPVVVYCIMNLDEIVKIPAVYLRYKKYIWLRDLTRKQA